MVILFGPWLFGDAVTAASSSPTSDPHSLAPEDSSGAQIVLYRQDEMLRIRGMFVNDTLARGTLTFELEVRRTGDAGTTRSTQSGRFETAPDRTDTLSTVQVNVQAGDRLDLHLDIHRGDTLIDSTRRRHVF